MSSNLRRLGNQISVPIPADPDGFTGRECPDEKCLGYFKIQFGTGLKGEHLPCHCPYCGHIDGHDKFWTQEQLEYAKSVVLNKLTAALLKDLKSHEFSYQPRGPFSIGMSLKVTGQPESIQHYREKQLETVVVCDRCTLRYAIYGVFAFCPDCGTHNSLQILEKNLELALKEIALADQVDIELAQHLTGDALENAVSSFDGFGRETCKVFAVLASAPDRAGNISFQNLIGARQRISELFGIDLSLGVNEQDWSTACQCFQKRHLLAHKMGVVDQPYIDATHDPQAIVGRKITIRKDEVSSLIEILSRLGAYMVASFSQITPPSPS
jgi:hypothetical protein